MRRRPSSNRPAQTRTRSCAGRPSRSWAAAATGLDVRRGKLYAFSVSSFLAGVGGCLLAYQRQTLSATSFAVFESLALLALTYLAGIASVGGALLAGAFAKGGLLTVAMGQGSSEYQFALNGVALIVVAIVYPNGIMGAIYALFNRVWPRRADSAGDARPDESPGRSAAPARPAG